VDFDVVLGFVNVLTAGLLAGAELVVRFGVRGPIATLDPPPQIQLRQALIRALRLLVPSFYVPTILTGVAVVIVDGAGTGFGFRCVALAAVLGWTLVTFAGTVPINKATLTWTVDAPPDDWKTLVARWERLDTARACAASVAFVCFLAALALRSGS
jgi:uncharacterized membrane protein